MKTYLTDNDVRIAESILEGNDHFYLLPKTESTVSGEEIEQFILELTDSTTIEEAHKQIEDIVGYSVDSRSISPLLKSKRDAMKVIWYFIKTEDLFD